MSADKHDPGGKVRLNLSSSVTGTARFSPCGRYRDLLERSWPGAERDGLVLWIGMNPSTAAGDVDDPTVAKECKFTRRWGYGRYVKTNVMDYRATHPRMLLEPEVKPCSPANLTTIRSAAEEAELVVLAFGSLHKKLLIYGEQVIETLDDLGITPLCLGLTKAGLPRHPLYLRDDTDPFPFPMPSRKAA